MNAKCDNQESKTPANLNSMINGRSVAQKRKTLAKCNPIASLRTKYNLILAEAPETCMIFNSSAIAKLVRVVC